jgi:AraC-like DNA-binding protein
LITRFRRPGARSPLLTAGYIHDKNVWCRSRTMDAYALVYLLAGAGAYSDPHHREVSFEAGAVLVLFPGLAHSYGPRPGKAWSEGYLVFYGEVFAALETEGVLRRDRPVLLPGLSPRRLAAFDALINEQAMGPLGDPYETTLRLHALLVDVQRADERRREPAADRMELARARLEQELTRPLDVRRLARELGMGYETFRKRFAKTFGISPAHYRLERRIDRTKSLLAAREDSLAEIAKKVGFCDEFYLSHKFKELTGSSPGSYRAAMRGTVRT